MVWSLCGHCGKNPCQLHTRSISWFDWHGVTFDGLRWGKLGEKQMNLHHGYLPSSHRRYCLKRSHRSHPVGFFGPTGEWGFFLSVSIQINNEATSGTWLWTDMRLQCGQKCNNNPQTIKRNAMTWRNDIALWSPNPPPPHSFTLPDPGPGHSYNQLRCPAYKTRVTRSWEFYFSHQDIANDHPSWYKTGRQEDLC